MARNGDSADVMVSEVEPAARSNAGASVVYDRREFLWANVMYAAVFSLAFALIDRNGGGELGAAIVAVLFSIGRIRIIVEGDFAKLDRSIGFATASIEFREIANVEIRTRWLSIIGFGTYVQLDRVSGRPLQLDTSDPQGLYAAIERVRAEVV